MDKKLLGQNIKFLRLNKGWGQEYLAELLGVAKAQVSRYESGSSLPRTDSLYLIAELFEVTTDDLGYTDISKEGINKKPKTYNDTIIIELLMKEVVRLRDEKSKSGDNDAAINEAIEDAVAKLRAEQERGKK